MCGLYHGLAARSLAWWLTGEPSQVLIVEVKDFPLLFSRVLLVFEVHLQTAFDQYKGQTADQCPMQVVLYRFEEHPSHDG